MGLCREVVYLIRTYIVYQLYEIGTISEISVVEKEIFIWIMGVLIEMIYSFRIEKRRPPLNSMYFVPLGEKEFC